MENNQDKIQFIPHHRPTLTPGHYRIELKQQVTIKGKKPVIIEGPVRDLVVRGERFELREEWIDSVFPPENSEGDYGNCLAHVVINRGTLPWERAADNTSANTDGVPWLALLVFDEVDLRSIRSETIPLKELDKIGKKGLRENLEPGEQLTDSCSIISVPEKLLGEVKPELADMTYLAHIRKVSNEKKENYNPDSKETDYAVIVGNRLLEAGKGYTAYLVSLEGYYDNRKDSWYTLESGNIHLVFLKSWRFEVSPGSKNFKKILLDLNTGVFRCKKSESSVVDAFLEKGFTFMPHQLRQGDSTLSLYRGPFLPYLKKRNDAGLLPVEYADKLIRYNSGNGVFDVSYAAAWQLGRLLSLQNRNFSLALAKWKKLKKQTELLGQERKKLKEELGEIDPEMKQMREVEERNLKDEVLAWLSHLKLIGTLPLNYLVPAEEMLPHNSIRFFSVDLNWVDCLMDGAYSIARLTEEERGADAESFTNLKDASDMRAVESREKKKGSGTSIDAITGILLRSRVIADWPGLEIDAYSADGNKLPIYTMQKLADDILLVIFRDEIHRVDIHHPPEGLHFGICADGRHKKLRNRKTGEQTSEQITVEFRSKDSTPDKKILDIAKLASDLETEIKNTDAGFKGFGSGEFALQMIESADSVSFIKS